MSPKGIGSDYLAHLAHCVRDWSSQLEALTVLKQLSSFVPCLSSYRYIQTVNKLITNGETRDANESRMTFDVALR